MPNKEWPWARESESLQNAPIDMDQGQSALDVDTQALGAGTTEQSDDAKLIQLIQQLASLGIPMEQLRGRTEQELVEMMVYLSSQMGSQQGGNQMDCRSRWKSWITRWWRQQFIFRRIF